MRKLIFNRLLVAMLLMVVPAAVQANGNADGRGWKKLIPTVYTAQYAGDIGEFSIGAGWCYGKNRHWETHIIAGYLPRHHNPSAYLTMTAKECYIPWRWRFGGKVVVEPLYATLFVNTIMDDDFWHVEPNRYPKGYYGFSSKVRFHLGFGQRLVLRHSPKHSRVVKCTSLYYELSTCDLYVRQKFIDSYVPLKDIICLGVGLQWTI